jgi:histidinol dehydrogenase
MIPIYKKADADKFRQEISQSEVTVSNDKTIEESVKTILELVRNSGDQGVRALAAKFGDICSQELKLSDQERERMISQVSDANKKTIKVAYQRIKSFAQSVVDGIKESVVDCGDFQTGLDYRPVQRVACYVPAGRYPLPSTALMTAVTAQVAGVAEICIFCPKLEPEIVYAGTLAGVTEFYTVGGAQAVAAAAFGTESIAPVNMIVGPGNAYVTEAKRQVNGIVGIDMLAGPSEICVIADDGIDASLVALDLLSQAEHDPDARAYLLTDSEKLAQKVQAEVDKQINSLDIPDFIRESIKESAIVVLDSLKACCELANLIAPEHLLLLLDDVDAYQPLLTNYGAVFMGYGCTVAFGDYMAGPNHTLPTNRAARFQGCLSPLTFMRSQSWIRVKTRAPELAAQTEDFARIEGLTAHAAAARSRRVETAVS